MNLDVKKIARLARLRLSDGELSLFEGQLARILDHMAELSKVDTKAPGAAPPLTEALKRRPDISEGSAGDFLQNAPGRSGPFFKVPPVIE